MLSEAFLSTIMFQEVLNSDCQDQVSGGTRTSTRRHHDSVRRKLESKINGESSGDDAGYQRGPTAPLSQALCIPCRDMASDHSLDLYTSWSSTYASIYKNYPDLHIGGDHILNKKDSGCILDLDNDDGPVLLSVDIDSSSPPSDGFGELSEERFHDSEESNAFPPAPFSNSVLNGYLEKKMQELYKQCFEDNLTNMSTNVLMLNVNQMSLLISQEKNVDQAKAREAILQYLCSATSAGSSEFITPVLHISKQDSKKKSGMVSNSSALKKNPSLRIKT
ncbi:TLR adapter interacting with SLC15A4 on the lysosome-like [Hyperolius riggenbachi]|uniref:TLR adapter interacting with SLC15A4 on the lysosome-like n=1 Tax=Hyperolius riggenbachi TaxID=752182 RepID=UPI0035A26562